MDAFQDPPSRPGEMPSAPPPLPEWHDRLVKRLPRGGPRREQPPFPWTTVCAGAIGLAVGVALGLGIGAATGGSLAGAKREAEAARDEIAAVKAREFALADERDQFRDAAQKSNERAAEIKELEALRLANTRALLRSQALLRMVLESDAVRNTMNRHDVRHKLQGDWFFPETAYELIGGRWWLKELVDKGLLEKRILDELEAQERKEEEEAARRKTKPPGR